MEYRIALSSDVGLIPSNFVTACKEMQDAHSIAAVKLTFAPRQRYLEPAPMTIIDIPFGTFGVGVLTNAIYDVLKAALIKHGKEPTYVKTSIYKNSLTARN